MSSAADWTAPSLEDFEKMAEAAYRALPEHFRALTKGLVIRIEDFAEDDVLKDLGIESEFDLLGLFQGVGLAQDEAAPRPDECRIWCFCTVGPFWITGPSTRRHWAMS